MKKLKDIVLKHKGLSIVIVLALIVLIVMIITCLSLFVSGNNTYGHRLDGIDDVKLSKSKLDGVEDTIKGDESVSAVDVRLQGKIVYIDINFVNGTTKDKAKEIASNSLNEFDEEEIDFYDFEYLLQEEKSESDAEYVSFALAGTKHPLVESITWVKS